MFNESLKLNSKNFKCFFSYDPPWIPGSKVFQCSLE